MGKAAPNKVRLTDQFVRKITPDNGNTLIWDTAQGGLALQVTSTGTKSWKVAYRHRGRLRWYHIDRYPAIGLAEARDAARVVRAKAALGGDPQSEKMLERAGDTLKHIHGDYLEKYAKVKNKSWKQGERLMNGYVLPNLGGRKAREIARTDMRSLFRKVTANNGPVTANQMLAAASAVFSWAINEELIAGTNPCYGIERNTTKDRERVLSDQEVPLVWGELDKLDLFECNVLKLLLLTGQRPGEVSAMCWDHIDDEGWWTLPGDPEDWWPGTKNKQTHRVYLSETARGILSVLEGEDKKYVFGNAGRPMVSNRASAGMRQVTANLKMAEKVTAHDLRRTHGTTITSLGFTRDAMNRIQNHREGGIGSVYDRYEYADEAKLIQERVAEKIMALVEGRNPADSGNVTVLRKKGG